MRFALSRRAFGLRWMLPVALVAASLSRMALAATVTVINVDGAGEGLNDPTPVAPVGGNSGTTVGAQRLIALQSAANIWGSLLASNVTIKIDAKFDPLTCDATSAVLGTAGSIGVSKDFTGAPLANHYYASALANSIAGSDQDPTKSEIRATFNSNLGQMGCLQGSGFYYGLDGNEGVLTDLIPVVLHELAHGLGFINFVNLTSGSNTLGAPDAFEHWMLDLTTGKLWDAMSDAERVTSSTNTRKLVWSGPLVTAATPQTLAPGAPLLTASGAINGEFLIGVALFGPTLAQHPVTASLKLVQDSGGTTTDGCENIINNVSGAVALIDRGTCNFTVKVKNAQNAGAAAVLIADNVAGSPPDVLPGGDSTITIPSGRITMADGASFKTALMSGSVTVSLRADKTRLQGADSQHRAMLYTPSPNDPGSSANHWDLSATPDLLLEPIIFNDVGHNVDLTLPLLKDVGWSTPVTLVPASSKAWAGLAAGALAFAGIVMSRRRRASSAAALAPDPRR
jgi:hypothetical protein